MDTEPKPIHSGFGETTTADEVIVGRDLTGKVVVVTGGHSGIGLETTKVLSNAGATIVIGARDVTRSTSYRTGFLLCAGQVCCFADWPAV